MRMLRIQGSILVGGLLCGMLCGPSIAQSFSVATVTTSIGSSYNYAFALNYDQAGQVQGLTDNIWEWSFYLDPNTLIPTGISSPTGWKYLYTANTGEFDWYTEGPNGYGSGDFGNDVITPSSSLNGFQFSSPLPPDISVAMAYDQQFNSDANVATLPVAPTPVPEAGTATGLGLGILPILLLTVCRRLKSTARSI